MRNLLIILMSLIFIQVSCKKQEDWLNEPRSKADIILSKLKDYQELLNNTAIFNLAVPNLGQLGSDNYYLPTSSVNRVSVIERNSYLWRKDIFEGRNSADYVNAYTVIAYANIILHNVREFNIDERNKDELRNILGQAYFFRAFAYHELAALFCKPYNSQTANTDKGLCLRVTQDLDLTVKRSSVHATYELMLQDALFAAELLPATSKFKTQPVKPAAYALLARIYLNKGEYERASLYADSVISAAYTLMDFNAIPNPGSPFVFPDFKNGNSEVIFYAQGFVYPVVMPGENWDLAIADSMLYSDYEQNDLRKSKFFIVNTNGQAKFKGSYSGNSTNFSGLALNEVYLIRAESNARTQKLGKALEDINALLKRRFKTGSYREFYHDNGDSVLAKILHERRKELPFTGQIRWQDLRRLNLEPRLATTLKRKYNDEIISLSPNDSKYIYPFPKNEIDLAGIEQNDR